MTTPNTIIADLSAEINALRLQRYELLTALERLSFAAACRDNTMGDPCRLIEVTGELNAAAEEARAVIAEATKGGE